MKSKTEYIFFSGKGGVGKTSIAAATALHLSKTKKVLLISIDPAHSLSDSFETKIGGEVKKLKKNLFAVEIDPAKAVEEYKEKLSPKLETGALQGLGMEGIFDVAGMTPGIDELAAFDKFLQYMHETEYEVIIFDTAPTGHSLRFLSLPDVLDSWVGKMIAMRMRLSGMIGLFKKILPFGNPEDSSFGLEQLEAMKKRIAEAKKILSDPRRTRYNIVLIPEIMSILESERSLSSLKSYNIPVDTIFVNQILPENKGCSFCSAKRKQQTERIKIISQKFKEYHILTLNLMKEEVRGAALLEKVAKSLYS